MKTFRYILGFMAVSTAIIALLIGSIEIATFSSLSFYEKQYEKNNVLDAVGMEMDDLMDLTEYMLDYLEGKEDILSFTTTMWGEERDFFNDKERAHMEDVKRLNTNALTVMYSCASSSIICLGFFAASFFTPRRRRLAQDFLPTLCRCITIGTLVFIGFFLIGALVVSTNFEYYWNIFHKIFFTNDLWLLDPSTDMLINIVPLNFFTALVIRCALLFMLMILIMLIPSTIYLIYKRKRPKKRKPYLPRSLYLSLVSLCVALFCLASPIQALADDSITGLDDAPEISAQAAILIEKNTGTILYSKNADESIYPASTTKIMTALLTLENCELDEVVTFSSTAIYSLPTGASHIGMTVGETLTVEECLYALLLPSANEVANALAEHIAGSMSAFVNMMNERANELGCTNTNFANPSGLHADNHTTSAADLALIFQACLSTANFIQIDSTVTYVIGATNLVDETRPMKTTNQMIQTDSEYYDSRVVCGKTGHTTEAGGCLISYAKSDGMELICVVINAEQPAEYEITSTLLDYGFSSFTMTSSLDLERLLAASKADAPTFYTSSQITPYTLSGNQAVITTDFSLMSYSLSTDEDALTRIDLQAGSLTLSSWLLETATQDDNPLMLGDIPVSYLQAMSTPESSYLLLIILVALLLIILIFIFFTLRTIKKKPSKKTSKKASWRPSWKNKSRVFKNVPLKKL